jgi:hypothetical protein
MRAFNVFGRIVSILLGLLVVFAGIVWILQAFNTPMVPAAR